MIAIREAWQAGLLRREHWFPNLVAGVIVGVVALPLAMAFAIASGAKPEQGLYTASVAGLVVSLFGGSRMQIAGPTGAFIVILAGITAKYGVEGLQLATLMAGIILVLLGVARLGSVIKYIPDPVIVGFTAGIGVIIWVGQWQPFFGLPASSGTHFHEKFWHLLTSLPQLHPATTGLAVLSLVLVMFSARVPGLRRMPAPLVAMVIATVLQARFHFDGVATFGSAFGGIPAGLPEFTPPSVSFSRVIELIGPAFTIAMLGAIESLLAAMVADGMAGTKHNSNQELIGQGVANIISPLFGGFAATGAIARTATNVRYGGNSPLAGRGHSAGRTRRHPVRGGVQHERGETLRAHGSARTAGRRRHSAGHLPTHGVHRSGSGGERRRDSGDAALSAAHGIGGGGAAAHGEGVAAGAGLSAADSFAGGGIGVCDRRAAVLRRR